MEISPTSKDSEYTKKSTVTWEVSIIPDVSHWHLGNPQEP